MASSESDPFDYVDHTDLESPHANQPDCQLVANLVEHDHHPDEYAVTPVGLESDILTTWITIDADDMLDLGEWQ